MKNSTILILGFGLTIPGFSNAASIDQENSVERKYCGYHIEEKLSKNITEVYSTLIDGIYRTKVNISINLAVRSIQASFDFSCYAAPETDPYKHKTERTARTVMEMVDSGGRYYRVIKWESKARGKGWTGTIAYTNEIFGDNQKSENPDQFLICPKNESITCFYINISPENRLSGKEPMEIKEVLSNISIEQTQKK
ncbi:hypothetical protein [Pseudomonas sp.]|uniref:hypothetical protein n=1 Tax=Pseudomonas sp. TaxID=306 RepID=UPI00290643DA|nr:hypothetical protein [Pseudomonas sp.]MDU4255985.1 hypothetical protein [Pseudomonas sp.]